MNSQFLFEPVLILLMCLNQQVSQSRNLSPTIGTVPQGHNPICRRESIRRKARPLSFARQDKHLVRPLSSADKGTRQSWHNPCSFNFVRSLRWYSKALSFDLGIILVLQLNQEYRCAGAKSSTYTMLPGITALLKSGIVQAASLIKLLVEGDRLRLRGVQSVFERSTHLQKESRLSTNLPSMTRTSRSWTTYIYYTTRLQERRLGAFLCHLKEAVPCAYDYGY